MPQPVRGRRALSCRSNQWASRHPAGEAPLGGRPAAPAGGRGRADVTLVVGSMEPPRGAAPQAVQHFSAVHELAVPPPSLAPSWHWALGAYKGEGAGLYLRWSSSSTR